MAIVHVETSTVVVVDRDMRNVLRSCLRSEAYRLEQFERVIRASDGLAAHEALACAVRLVEMFDQMGWEADDPRNHYEITVDLDSFVPWLRGLSSDLAESLSDESTHEESLTYRWELQQIETLLERLEGRGERPDQTPDQV